MSFTKRDFEAVARIIREERAKLEPTQEEIQRGAVCCIQSPEAYSAIVRITDALSAHFAADNPRFDAERFARACEPGGGK